MDEHVAYEDLIAFAAQEASPALSAAIAAHVSGCRRCAATVKYFQLAADSIHELGSEMPSAAVRSKVYGLVAAPAPAPAPAPTSWLASLGALFSFPRLRLANATAVVILVLAVLLVGSVGTIAVSQNAVTGEGLYPVKTAMENARVGLEPNDAGRTEQYMNMAGSRVEEIQKLVQRQEFDGIPGTAAAYEVQVKAAIQSLQALFGQDAAQARTVATRVNKTLAEYTGTLQTLINNVPIRIKPALAGAVSVSTAALSTLIDLQTPPTIVPLPAATETPTVSPVPQPSDPPVPQPSVTTAPPSPVPTIPLPVVAPTVSTPTLEPTAVTPTLAPTLAVIGDPLATATPTLGPDPTAPGVPTDADGDGDDGPRPTREKNVPPGSQKTPGPPVKTPK